MRDSKEPTFKHLEEYGIVGNLETCALIGRDGSVDWLCFPYLESPSVFSALLDEERGGHLRIKPVTKYESIQSYDGHTNILLTTFTTPLGDAVVTDFMPVKGTKEIGSVSVLLKKIECVNGMIKMAVSVKPRFNYAAVIPDVEPAESGIIFRQQDEFLFFQSSVPLFIHDGEAIGSLALKTGDFVWFALQYNHHSPLNPGDPEKILKVTKEFWLDWAHKCDIGSCLIEEPWHHLAVRSGLVLKLLSNPDTGAIAAAATTSLPERIGGTLNWDYRYAWIRDASLTDQALFHLGHLTEAQAFRHWIIGIVGDATGEPGDIMTMYTLHGGETLEEKVLERLTGYEGSRPVRIGNAAAKQRQLDIFGEMLNAIYDTTRHGEEVPQKNWNIFRKIVDYVCTVWDTKDAGIWEMRGEPRHFVYSKLMCWVAVDRGIKIATEKELQTDLDAWEKTKETISGAILEKGFSPKLNSFVQSFDSEIIDATSLLIAPMGLLPHSDPRVYGTIEAVLEKLTTRNGLVYRYEGVAGLPPEEGCFFLCSCWLVKALVLSDRLEEAEKIFANLIGYISPLGLLSEEVDPVSGRLIGNFPQAFSHIGIINSALYLGIAKGRKYAGPKPLGVS
jgi:GH15 family glucan-1,4-alpha-glucosidase